MQGVGRDQNYQSFEVVEQAVCLHREGRDQAKVFEDALPLHVPDKVMINCLV